MNFEVALPRTEEAVFCERLNRFCARVLWRGKEAMAHVPNSGRLRELLLPGARVLVRPGGGAKTACRLMAVRGPAGLSLLDAQITNDILEAAVRTGAILDAPEAIQREVKYGSSRLDLACRSGGVFHLVEAKCVTLVREGTALFPDAPTSRGERHLQELTQAAAQGFVPHVVFLVQQPGAERFCPNRETDPAFADALEAAGDAGVRVHVLQLAVSERKVSFVGFVPWARCFPSCEKRPGEV